MRNRLLAEIKFLEDEVSLLLEKRASLQRAHTISADPIQRFSLEKAIEELTARLGKFEARLNVLEPILAELNACAKEALTLTSELDRLRRALAETTDAGERHALEACLHQTELRLAEVTRRSRCADELASGSVPLTALQHNLPDVASHAFVGRESELNRLDALLAEDPSVVVRSIVPNQIGGMPGVGKSLLVIVYARRHLHEYDGVFWIDAAGKDLQDRLAGLARRLKLAPEAAPEKELADALAKLFERGRYLLILDNVDHPRSFQRHIPNVGASRVIITTRRRDLQGIAPGKQLNLDVLPIEDAFKLLASNQETFCEDPDESESLRTIAKELGCLPMALSLAAQVLHFGSLKPSQLLLQLRSQGPCSWSLCWQQETTAEGEDGPAEFFRLHRCLPELFETSYALIPSRRSETLAQVGGFFAPEGIDIELLIDAAMQLSADGSERERYYPSLENLVRLGLCQIDKRNRTVIFHRLVQDFLRHKGGAQAEQAVIDTLAARVQKADVIPDEIRKLGTHRAHLEVALRHIRHEKNPNGLWVAIGLIRYLTFVAEYAAAHEMCMRFIPAAGETLQGAWLWHQAGWALRRLARHREALRAYRRALSIWKGLCKAPANGTQLTRQRYMTIQEIGVTLLFRGHYRQASPYMCANLAYALRSSGDRGLGTAIADHNFGLLQLSLGDNELAEACFRRSLELKESLGRGRDVLTANTIHVLGHLCERTGRHDEAIAYYQQAMDIRESFLSSSHIDYASSLCGVAQVLLRRNQCESALSLFRRALDVKRRCLPSPHPDLAAIECGIGRAYTMLGQFDDAEAALVTALEMWQSTLGKAHPASADGCDGLGELMLAKGDVAAALVFHQQALGVLSRRLGLGHPLVEEQQRKLARM